MTSRREAVAMLAAGALASTLPRATLAASEVAAPPQAPASRADAAATTSAPPADPFDTHDALGLAALVRGGEVSAAELLELALRRAARVEPRIGAIAVDDADAARLQLRSALPAGPFAGVPFLLKDLGTARAGTITTAGSRYFADARYADDDELVRRHLRAGLVIFGKSASPELGLTGTTESVLHGATRNPWDLERTAGGSSGGAAAAVAARIVPLAHASDGAGSIRIPRPAAGCSG